MRITRRRTTFVALVIAVAALSGCSSGGSGGSHAGTPARHTSAVSSAPSATPVATRPAGTFCGWLPRPPATYAHVIWIWFENKSKGSVVGSPNAPFFGTVQAKCGLATNFHNISHPSLPNYLAATSGRTDGVARDCSPSSCSSTSRSIFRQLQNVGRTWKGYAESMPRNCAIFDTPPYAARHNPPVYYIDVKSTCHNNDVPLGTTSQGNLASDLADNTLPNFAFITPNLCSDMHDCSVSTGDAWLKKWLTQIVKSTAYSTGTTAVFVTFDEGAGGSHGEDCASATNSDPSCTVATYVLGPSVRPGTTSDKRFTHYSLLRTTETLLGLKTYLGSAATAAGMRAAFRL